ncbi:MAG: site-specific DNA-methyltransferase, partial [Clostridia bacterium]|nr:site-specific DNA-methyltransferase [Clostridia bacterium]
MELNKIFFKSSEDMSEIPDKSIDLIVTSPPYNIDIKYGNTTKNGKVLSSKGT